MNRHTSHGNSPYRLRKKFGSTRTMFTPHTHQFEMCYLCECVRTLYSMTIGQWSVKIMVLSCKESQFIEGLFWNQFGYLSFLPLLHSWLNTVESHCLLYIPNFQNISKCHGRMGFADDFVQWCGERYEIEIKHTLPCHHTDTHTHTQMCAQTHFKLMCEHWLCRAELPHEKSLQRPILGTWHYCCWSIISLTKETGN